MDGFIGEGYGIPYSEAIDTLRLLARREGVVLDPTYTAKGFAGLLAAIHQGGLRAGATPLFLHTGGGFGLMAQRMLV
jgi:L-cysteate sulfo-lyase